MVLLNFSGSSFYTNGPESGLPVDMKLVFHIFSNS